jgi:hypothetical protein
MMAVLPHSIAQRAPTRIAGVGNDTLDGLAALVMNCTSFYSS